MLINKDAILNSEVFTYPWEHQIIDDILDPQVFEKIRSISKILVDMENIRKHSLLAKKFKQSTFGPYNLYQEFDTYDLINCGIPEDIVELMHDCSQEFLNLTPEIQSRYSNPRVFEEYFVVGRIHMDFPGLPRDVHDESDRKTISIVIYLDPDENEATSLHTDHTEESVVKLPEWKPNRGLIFCGETGKTWHSYTSIKKLRFVFAIFIEKVDNTNPMVHYKFSNGKISTAHDSSFFNHGIPYLEDMKNGFKSPYVIRNSYL